MRGLSEIQHEIYALIRNDQMAEQHFASLAYYFAVRDLMRRRLVRVGDKVCPNCQQRHTLEITSEGCEVERLDKLARQPLDLSGC